MIEVKMSVPLAVHRCRRLLPLSPEATAVSACAVQPLMQTMSDPFVHMLCESFYETGFSRKGHRYGPACRRIVGAFCIDVPRRGLLLRCAAATGSIGDGYQYYVETAKLI